jgi:hypothetical protein
MVWFCTRTGPFTEIKIWNCFLHFMKVERVMGSIYLTDSRVDRHYPFSIWYHHAMKIHTQSISTFGINPSAPDFMHKRNCVNLGLWVLSYDLLQSQPLFEQNHSMRWIHCVCCERCGGVLLVGLLISTMYLSHCKPPGVPERMWSVTIDALLSGEIHTLGVQSSRASEYLRSLTAGARIPWEWYS